jgi:polar amino acid transport system substrate-binding protein
MNKKIIIGAVVVVLVIVGVFAFFYMKSESEVITGKVVDEKSEERILSVATLEWKPFMYEENGAHKGIGVDVMDEVLDNLNVDYNLVFIPWSRALKLAEVGEVDAVLGATYKEDRESYIDYTSEQRAYGKENIIPETYLYKTDYILFIKKANEEILEFESIDQITIDGYTVGVNQDFSYTPAINNALWDTVVHFDEERSFNALLNDEMDFFLASKEVGLDILNKIGLSDEITYIDTPVDTSYIFLVFSKNSDYPDLDRLIERVDEELISIHASGEYDEIYDKYIQE